MFRAVWRRSLIVFFTFFIAILTAHAAVAQERGTYRIDTEQSRLWFTGKSTVHNFTARASVIRGTLQSTVPLFENPSLDPSRGEVRVPVRKLDSGNESRDSTMYGLLRADEYPRIRFQLVNGEIIRSGDSKERFRARIEGVVSAAGETEPIRTEVQETINSTDQFTVKGSFPLHMTDFEIEPPSFMYLVQTRDRIDVHFDLNWKRHADQRDRPNSEKGAQR